MTGCLKAHLAIATSHHAIFAINWLAGCWLKWQLGDFTTTTSASHINIEHLARSAWAAVETAAEPAGTTFAVTESAVALCTVNWTITGWLKRQLRDVCPAFCAGKIHIEHLPWSIVVVHNKYFLFPK